MLGHYELSPKWSSKTRELDQDHKIRRPDSSLLAECWSLIHVTRLMLPRHPLLSLWPRYLWTYYHFVLKLCTALASTLHPRNLLLHCNFTKCDSYLTKSCTWIETYWMQITLTEEDQGLQCNAIIYILQLIIRKCNFPVLLFTKSPEDKNPNNIVSTLSISEWWSSSWSNPLHLNRCPFTPIVLNTVNQPPRRGGGGGGREINNRTPE